jgi:hypothetical protein
LSLVQSITSVENVVQQCCTRLLSSAPRVADSTSEPAELGTAGNLIRGWLAAAAPKNCSTRAQLRHRRGIRVGEDLVGIDFDGGLGDVLISGRKVAIYHHDDLTG